MSKFKTSNQTAKKIDFKELNSIKLELDSKVKDLNKLLKSIQEKDIQVEVKKSTVVIDDSLLTEWFYSTVDINLSVQI